MPYSAKHNVLFIHIPKCAGKSFEVAMGIVSKDEVTKYKWRSNFNRFGKYILKNSKDVKALPRVWGVHDMTLALQHLTYAEIELLDLLDREILKNTINVAIVRNPYDRAVSSFHHMGGGYKNFLDFLENYFASPNRDHNALAHKRPQIDFLRNKKGEIVVNEFIKFENLNDDFEAFKLKYGIHALEIPHLGKQSREKSFKDYYCQESINIVESIFKDDIDFFDYKF